MSEVFSIFTFVLGEPPTGTYFMVSACSTLPPFEDELDDLGTRNKNGASNRDLVTKYPMEDKYVPVYETIFVL